MIRPLEIAEFPALDEALRLADQVLAADDANVSSYAGKLHELDAAETRLRDLTAMLSRAKWRVMTREDEAA